ncbi:(2Fe-2S)-binding protein, partial [Streptomyces sp. SID8455]|nr:(2Fe-2S)-binding protein [Streptomyces sp. SID8455]
MDSLALETVTAPEPVTVERSTVTLHVNAEETELTLDHR